MERINAFYDGQMTYPVDGFYHLCEVCHEITVTTFDVTDSENLWRVVIVAENDASDYSQVEMVVRLSAEE